jgi:hypothetical protein
MRKIIVFLGILALVLGTAGVAPIYAGTYGTDVTHYDNAVQGGVGWYNRGNANNYTSEDKETEPGTTTGQSWDLEAFQFNKTGAAATLAIIGGWDFANGQVWNNETITTGALFLRVGTEPVYGSVNDGTPDHLSPIADNTYNWKYDYAIKYDFQNMLYTVYKDTTGNHSATVICYGSAGGNVGDVSNPYDISTAEGSGWTAVADYTNLTLYYLAGQGDFDGLTGGSHNIIYDIDLTFLNDADGNTPLTWLHQTYLCGNDNLMGQIPFTPIPLPPSALLLGSGLLGLVGLGWRRRQS